MSAGHHHHDKAGTAAELAELERYMADPRFDQAWAKFKYEDDSHDVAYGAGSNNVGDTVFYDDDFYRDIQAGKVLYDGKPFDPRRFIDIHEIVEWILIVLFGLDYAKAHRLATLAERSAVEHAGLDWEKYSSSFQRDLTADEAEGPERMPHDILLVAYEGSKLYAPLARMQGLPAGDEGRADERARAAAGRAQEPSAEAGGAKISHAEAEYHEGPGATGSHCAVCASFIPGSPPACKRVQSPIRANDGCSLFQPQESTMAKPSINAGMADLQRMMARGASGASPGSAGNIMPGPSASAGSAAPVAKGMASGGAPGMGNPSRGGQPPISAGPPQMGSGQPPAVGGATPISQPPHMHALTKASATHLLNSGHISPAVHRSIHSAANAGLAAHKAAKGAAPGGGAQVRKFGALGGTPPALGGATSGGQPDQF